MRRTIYNDDYQTCERTYAELRIYSKEVDPDFISNCLGVDPTESNKKGEIRRSRLGGARVIKQHSWFLSSEGKVHSKDLSRHLSWLIEKLLPVQKELSSLQRNSNLTMSACCVWWSAHGHGGPTLWPEHMKALADLDLECGLDIYFVSETLE